MHKTFLAAGIATIALTAQPAPAFAYDYVKDILIGNTVEISNQITGETSRFFFEPNFTVVMHVKGKPDETGKWRESGRDLCTIYPSQGKEVCTAKPTDVSVPGEKRFNGALPDGTKFDVLIRWLKGRVRY